MTAFKKLDREARNLLKMVSGKHPSCSSAIPHTPRENGGRGLCSMEEECKVTKIKAALKLHRNGNPAMAMVRKRKG